MLPRHRSYEPGSDIVNTTHHYIITETVPEFLELEKELPVLRDIRAFTDHLQD